MVVKVLLMLSYSKSRHNPFFKDAELAWQSSMGEPLTIVRLEGQRISQIRYMIFCMNLGKEIRHSPTFLVMTLFTSWLGTQTLLPSIYFYLYSKVGYYSRFVSRLLCAEDLQMARKLPDHGHKEGV